MATTLSNPSMTVETKTSFGSGRINGVVKQKDKSVPSVGTSAGSVDLTYTKDFTLPTASPLLLDLTSLVDPAGNTITFGHLTHFHVSNLSTISGENIAIGGGSNAVFALDDKPVKPNGGFAAHADPNPGITIDGTHKIFQLAAAAGTPSARVTFLGRSV